MSHLMKGKVYGLSLPKAKALVTGQPSRVAPLANSLMNKKASIFNQSDSDSDNSGKAQNAWNLPGLWIRITSMRIRIHLFTLKGSGSDFLPSMRIRIRLLIKFRDPQPILYRPSRAQFWASTSPMRAFMALHGIILSLQSSGKNSLLQCGCGPAFLL